MQLAISRERRGRDGALRCPEGVSPAGSESTGGDACRPHSRDGRRSETNRDFSQRRLVVVAVVFLVVVVIGLHLTGDPAGRTTLEAETALDPNLAETHAALGQIMINQRRFNDARPAYKRALAIDPNDLTANLWLAGALNWGGYLKISGDLMDKVLQTDPMLPNGHYWRNR